MNIKEHIEAGHYPVDSKDRPLVPTRGGGVVTICATDCPLLGFPLLGFMGSQPYLSRPDGQWGPDGQRYGWGGDHDLLPPPPRRVTKYAAVHQGAMCNLHWYESDGPARRAIAGTANGNEWALLTMEYEEP